MTTGVGTIKWFNPVKGHGFIVPGDGGGDVVILDRRPTSNWQTGEIVSFEYEMGESGHMRALNVRPAPLTLKAGARLVPFTQVHHVEIDQINRGIAVIVTHTGERHEARGFDAIEAVFALKPSAVEGERGLKWEKGSWAFHNMVGHPLMQILAWLGFKKLAIRVHDATTPEARGFR